MVLNEKTERRGGRRFLLHVVTCTKTSLIGGVVDQDINILRERLDRIGIHTTEH